MRMEGAKRRVPSTELCEHDMLNYFKETSSLLSNICVQVKAAQGKAADTPLHNIKLGNFVVIRDLRRKSWVAGSIPSAAHNAHSGESSREGQVGQCQPL